MKSSSLAVVFAILAAAASAASGQTAPPPIPIEPALIASTVDALGAVITREYIDPDVARALDARLKQALARGRYNAATTADALAGMLTRDLYEGSHDKHLAVGVIRETAPAPGGSTRLETKGARSPSAAPMPASGRSSCCRAMSATSS